MKAVKFNVAAMSAAAVAELSRVLQIKGVYRIEGGKRFALQGASHIVWEAQNGNFVYVSEQGELTQGYSKNVFAKSLHSEFVAVEYKAQNIIAFVPA
jgi:hypothetical protein